MSHDSSRPNNRILAALSDDSYQRLSPHLTRVSLPLKTIIYYPGQNIETVYFPIHALISLVNTLEDGSTTEIGLVGNMGMIGIQVILGSGKSKQLAIVQIEDSAMKLSAEVLKQEFDRGGELQKSLLHFLEIRLDETAQLAVCNRHHIIEARLGRWLLTVSDLIQSDELPLTQEFLGNMLGVQRTGVTLAARTLQQAGLIHYSRGKITILDRESLEDATCECYQLFRENINGE